MIGGTAELAPANRVCRPPSSRSSPNSNCTSAVAGREVRQRGEMTGAGRLGRSARRSSELGVLGVHCAGLNIMPCLHHHEAHDEAADRVEDLHGLALVGAGLHDRVQSAYSIGRSASTSVMGFDRSANSASRSGGTSARGATRGRRSARLAPWASSCSGIGSRSSPARRCRRGGRPCRHVVVEGHGLDAELAPDPAHRERLEALGVHDLRAPPRRSALARELRSRLDGHPFPSGSHRPSREGLRVVRGLTAYTVCLYSRTP